MKWILCALLLLNLALFAWLSTLPPPEPAPSPVASVDHVKRLLLLDELDASELRPRVLRTASPANAPADSAPPASGVCLSLGPVQGDEEAARMKEWLEARGARTWLRVGERRELALYWVYFPPLPDRTSAVARVEAMKEQGVEDIFMIRRGDMANAVSLGVYSRRTSLERRLEELKSKGYEASVVPRYRTKKATWYDAQFAAGFDFPSDRFTLEFPAAQVIEMGCGELRQAGEQGPANDTPPAPAAAGTPRKPLGPGTGERPAEPDPRLRARLGRVELATRAAHGHLL